MGLLDTLLFRDGDSDMMRFVSILVLAFMMIGCSATPDTPEARDALAEQSQSTMDKFRDLDSRTNAFFGNAYGYAVFPKITKGSAGIGGAYGRGVVYKGGQMTGYAGVTQGSIGAQLGGMSWSEIVFFQNRWAYDKFTSDEFAASADASWAGPDKGGANTLNYSDGVMIFTMDARGLSASAAIGAQQFNFEAAN